MSKSKTVSRYSYLEAESGEVATNLSYELFIMVVTLITLFLLAGIYLLPFPPQVVQVLTTVDYMVAIIFMLDFLRSLILAQHSFRYLSAGLDDMLGSLPGFPLLCLLRIFRLVRSGAIWQEHFPTDSVPGSRNYGEHPVHVLAILVVITIGSSLV
jgi:hypothetical protein